MHRSLRLHPDGRRDAVSRIDVEVTRSQPGRITLHYRLTGRIDAIAVPPIGDAARSDELWRHTCFELFLKPAGSPGYWEFNFSPSRQWAAYRFDGYRSGMRPAEAAPTITVEKSEGRLDVRVGLDLPPGASRLGLSAVIEENNGSLTYWALTHPPGKPDFHHADGFALELPSEAP